MSELIVGFEFDLWELGESDQLTFGRDADLSISHDLALDATLGVLRLESGRWSLRNLGSTTILTMHDTLSGTSTKVLPGCSVAVPRSFEISFDGAGESYEIRGTRWQPVALQDLHDFSSERDAIAL